MLVRNWLRTQHATVGARYLKLQLPMHRLVRLDLWRVVGDTNLLTHIKILLLTECK
jgi:hypothetical protein